MHPGFRLVWAATLCLILAAPSSCRQSDSTAKKKPVAESAAPTPEADPNVPFRVAAVDTGKAVSSSKRIVDPTTTFQRYDVIYVSVSTEGSGPEVALKMRWTFGDADNELVHEAVQMISPAGAMATEFHIVKQDGWVPGQYKAEVFVDGKPAGAVEYTVAK